MNSKELTVKEQKEIDDVIAEAPYLHLIGIKVEKVERGCVKVFVEDCEQLKQQTGIVHGGAIASLLDTSSALSVITLLDAGQTTTTIDLTIHYLRPISSGKISAIGKVIRAGRKVITVSAEVFDKDEKLCATALTTYLRLA